MRRSGETRPVTMVAGPHVGGDELVFELTTPDLREWIRIAAPGRPQVLSRLWHRLRVVPRIRICYGDVTAGRLLAGTITLTATLQPSGALTDIEVSEATGALGAVAACAVTRLALDDEGTSVRPLRPLPIVVDVTFSPRASPAP